MTELSTPNLQFFQCANPGVETRAALRSPLNHRGHENSAAFCRKPLRCAGVAADGNPPLTFYAAGVRQRRRSHSDFGSPRLETPPQRLLARGPKNQYKEGVSTNPLIEIRKLRLQKAASARALGLNPYPSRAGRTHYAKTILDDFAKLQGAAVTVAGRLVSWRRQGALAFGHVQDQSGRIQLFCRRQVVQPTDQAAGILGYSEANLLDLGDIVEAAGEVVKTERGEISILVRSLRLLAKAIRPLPDQWSGLKDREQVLRKRYLDAILEPASFDRFGAISRMVAAVRTFLNGRGFLEFQTPVIQPQYGGGTAKPFKTHVNALGCEMYLAISHELYLKRLIVAGFDKVYTIGRYFRNEGIDRCHHPEFSMVETMAAYENYLYNMNLVEEMFRHVAASAFGKTEFRVRGHTIDFSRPWRRVSMAEAVKEKTGVDFRDCRGAEEANAKLAGLGIQEPQPSAGEALVKAFELTVEPSLLQPTLVFGHPVEISPLAKPMAEDPRFAERFEIFIAGMECGDNWSEQNDPEHLRKTFERAYRAEERDTGKFHTLDIDFIEALEYGMPPTTGIGPGVERMAMIFTEQENIDDVIFFPMMRPSVSQVNKEIYGINAPDGPLADLVLIPKNLEELCNFDLLEPQSESLTLQPYITEWREGQRYFGHVEIEGFFVNRRLLVTGFDVKSQEDEFFLPLEGYLRKKYGGKITVSKTKTTVLLKR
jgi:lysyl-tRNA synthetase class 2